MGKLVKVLKEWSFFYDHLDIRVEDRTTKQVYKPMNVLYMYSAFIILINMGLLKDTGCLDKCTLWLSVICKLQTAYIHTNTYRHISEPIVAHQSNSWPTAGVEDGYIWFDYSQIYLQ